MIAQKGVGKANNDAMKMLKVQRKFQGVALL